MTSTSTVATSTRSEPSDLADDRSRVADHHSPLTPQVRSVSATRFPSRIGFSVVRRVECSVQGVKVPHIRWIPHLTKRINRPDAPSTDAHAPARGPELAGPTDALSITTLLRTECGCATTGGVHRCTRCWAQAPGILVRNRFKVRKAAWTKYQPA